ncbi:MAG: DNA polymerase II, partial [Pseudomonadota bacterium]
MNAKTNQQQSVDGLILSRQWYDTSGGQSLVFWLASADGPVRIEFTNQESVFFIRQRDQETMTRVLPNDLVFRTAKIDLRCFSDGVPALACYFGNQRDLGLARSALAQAG